MRAAVYVCRRSVGNGEDCVSSLHSTRSPITSRSNWANESNTLSANRPMLEVVLNDLGHRDEGDGVFIEQFDELGEVGERSCEPVDFVDDDDVAFSAADLVKQRLQGGAVERSAG